MPSELELVGRLLLAMLLGGIVGFERELSGQPAGLRTSMTVALGAALFGIVSAYSFGEFVGPRNDSTYNIDVARVASNVVVGVGFLGGGTIIKHGASVRGLTTAATMWVTAAVGLGVGLGTYIPSSVATLSLVLALTLLRRPRRWLRQMAPSRETVTFHLEPASDVGGIVSSLYEMPDIQVRSLSVRRTEESTVVQAELKGNDLEPRVAEFARRRGVDVDIV